MPPDDKRIDLNDPAAQARDTDDVDDDLGSDLPEEKDEADDKAAKTPAKPAKKAAVKTPPEEEEDEEEESEEEEEEDEPEKTEDPEKTKLAKQLARAGRAREALENQLREARERLEQQTAAQSESSRAKYEKTLVELDELYEKVEELRAEGKAGEAAKAQRKIDSIRDNMTRAQAGAFAAQQAVKQTETNAYNAMVRELEYIEPRLDPESDEFDEELLSDVSELVSGYESKGDILTDALRKACRLVLREDPFRKSRSLARTDKTPADDKKAPKKTDKRATDVDKNLAAAKKQPPEEPGSRAEKATEDPDMSRITEADFDVLPKATLDRLLGNA